LARVVFIWAFFDEVVFSGLFYGFLCGEFGRLQNPTFAPFLLTATHSEANFWLLPCIFLARYALRLIYEIKRCCQSEFLIRFRQVQSNNCSTMLKNKLLCITKASFLTLALVAVTFEAPAQKPKKNVATRDQARTCLTQEQEIATLKTKGDNNQRTNLAMVKEAQEGSKALDELQAKVDKADQQQVDDFNAKTREHNAFVASVNQQAATMKSDSERYISVTAKFNLDCTNLIVTAADRKAIANEKK
jgi:hypothetical protein